jgi:holo-ACP synthase/triphosphoribosyl-dephospho-CoA synthase
MNLNVPGYPKSNHGIRTFFLQCLHELKIFLAAHRVEMDENGSVNRTDEAGDFFIASLKTANRTNHRIKQICEEFEEKHPLGRFIDVDITDAEGMPVTSGKQKICFYCNEMPAVICSREKRHPLEELRVYMFTKTDAYNRQQYELETERRLVSLAIQSILYEISLTPKPGLVDKISNGSHKDMHFLTFINSTAAVSGYFAELVKAGFVFRENDLSRALPVIRAIGLNMENAMYEATGQVNTQKGIIFLMGLSLFSCGYLYARQDVFQAGFFREIVQGVCKDIVGRELGGMTAAVRTHGEAIYQQYKFPGARGEAENGFPLVFDFGLPELMKSEETDEKAMLKAFLAIAAHNNDSNILFRGNPDILERFKAMSLEAMSHADEGIGDQLTELCREKNISPGGSADLLAVSIFIASILRAESKGGLNSPIHQKHDF